MSNKKVLDVKELMGIRAAVIEEIRRIDMSLENLSDEFINILDTQNKDGLEYFRKLVKEDKNRTNQKAWYLKSNKHKEEKKAYQKEYYLQNQERKRERDQRYQQNQKIETYIEKMLARKRRGTSPNIEF